MIAKLEWEIEQLKMHVGSEEAQYIAINIAMTAFHTLDWIAWEVTEKDRWAEATKNLGIEIDMTFGQKKKLRTLQEFAKRTSSSMRHLVQIALAGKHRNHHELELALSTESERIRSVAVVKDGSRFVMDRYVVQYAVRSEPDADGIPTTIAGSMYMLALEAHDWLVKFYDDCCIRCDPDPTEPPLSKGKITHP